MVECLSVYPIPATPRTGKATKWDNVITLALDVNGFTFVFVVYYRRLQLKDATDFTSRSNTLLSPKSAVVGDFDFQISTGLI